MSDNDHNAILHADLNRVFNERVAARRIVAIREFYREDAELHKSGILRRATKLFRRP